MGELSCWKVEGSVSSACQYFSRKGTVDHGAKPYGFITASKSEKKKKNKKIADFFLLQKLHYQTSQIYRDVSIGAAESE